MSAKVYNFLAYKQKKEARSPQLERYYKLWTLEEKAWEREQNEKQLMCRSCRFWGIEPGVNKQGCTHPYRNFYEHCPLMTK